MTKPTVLYFLSWMFKRIIRALFNFPIRIHKNFMHEVEDHPSLAIFIWIFCTLLGLTVVSSIGAVLYGVPGLVATFIAGSSFAILYLIGCFVLDQYSKFKLEQMATWDNLKKSNHK